MKTALCAIAKLENHYIKEWTDYHINLGFDKIFIYDNNDKDGEHFDDLLAEYTANNKVQIINFRGRKWGQIPAFNHCYQTYGSEYDWMAFIDIDEFITLTKDTNINSFLNNPRYTDFNGIYLKWVYYTDNDLLEVVDNNYNCLTRFTAPDTRTHLWDYLEYGKRIIRTGLKVAISSSHGTIYDPSYRECYASGEPVLPTKLVDCRNCYHDNAAELQSLAYIKHFSCKSLQEFLNFKFTRGYPIPYRRSGMGLDLHDYFKICNLTKEKLDYIQTWLDHYYGPKDKVKLQEQLNKYREELENNA